MSKARALTPEDNLYASGGEHPPVALDEAVSDLLNKTIEGIGERPIEMNINGNWEHPQGQLFAPAEQPATLERSIFDHKKGIAIALGTITVGAALTAIYTYRHKQKKK